MQFDDFYRTIGVFGRYQKTKYFLICLTYMLPPLMVYSWTFTAATPSFRCRTPVDGLSGVSTTEDILRRYVPSERQCRTYQGHISIRECQKCFQRVNDDDEDGRIVACTSLEFNRTYYQSTLVEEVGVLIDADEIFNPCCSGRWFAIECL